MPVIFSAAKDKPKKDKPKKESLAKSANPLAAFIHRPKNIKFETQEKKEKIVLLLRRHWLTNVSWLLGVGLMMFFPIFFTGFLPFWQLMPFRFQLITIISWYLLTMALFLEKSLSWLFNVNIITDERVVDVDFPSLLYREITSAKIDHIEDVSVKVGGFSRSLFNFGDVLIQTAGAEPEICFEDVPRPGQVVKVLNQMVLEEEQEKLEGRVR